MNNIRYLALSIILILYVTLSISQENFTLKSGPQQVSLIELYTSEGCSSCPPAEKRIGKWKKHKQLWIDFVPIAFHVHYWDYLGWKDPFAHPLFTARQRRYVHHWKSRTIYTPNFINHGKDWRNWRQSRSLPDSSNKPGVLSVRRDKTGNYQIAFYPQSKSKNCIVHIALLGFGLTSKVKSGENRGQTLHHEFVALGYNAKRMKLHKIVWQAYINVKPVIDIKPKAYALAVWVTGGNDPSPIQAVGGYLDKYK